MKKTIFYLSILLNVTCSYGQIVISNKPNAMGNVLTITSNNIANKSIVAEHSSSGVGIFTSSNGGTGILAQANGVNGVAISGNTIEGKAVYGTTSTGIGGFFEQTGRGGKALYTTGDIQITNIGEAVNRVLTSDATGGATWQELPKIAFMASSTSGLTIPTNTTQNIDFDGIDFNVGGGFSTTTDRFTAFRDGIYHLDVQVYGQSNMVGTYIMSVSIYTIANVIVSKYNYFINPSSTISQQYSRSLDVKMNSTDYAVVQISTTVTSGSTFTISPLTGRTTSFSGHYVCGL